MSGQEPPANQQIPRGGAQDHAAATGQQARVDKFFDRATDSHAEARKLVFGLAVAAVGVSYGALTRNETPTLGCISKTAATITLAFMALSAGAGLLAWRTDAKWAYEVADNFSKDANLTVPKGDPYHDKKRRWDNIQLATFVVGLLSATFLTAWIVLVGASR